MPPVLRRPLAAGIATLGVVALIAGCGGGGSDTLSADEFRTQADAICADYNTKAAAIGDPASPSEFSSKLAQIVPLQAAQLSKLEALKAPDELKDTFAEAVTLLKKQQATLTDAQNRIAGGEDPTTVINSISAEASATGDEADQKAKELGLKVCGTDSSAGTDTTAPTATAPATTAATTTTAPAGTATTATANYVSDVQAAATALQAFGQTLQSSTGVADLKAKVPEARKNLDDFDAAIAKLDSYTIPIPRLEKQRAGLAETGPKVSDVLRRFLDAAASGDLGAVTKLLPEVQSTIGEFQAAATG
jgi:hypothetical protein